ncbi:hypothetical protein [Carboxylicivirga caseinilyticus]|uniref:hypothetical protein n=1 Tax=Carboxylicivirga caseinilyticus TaxID=3417572 RepID=UPI003D33504A|nr:hypothetical protein [Marinilabiliaceae bacterium A049]
MQVLRLTKGGNCNGVYNALVRTVFNPYLAWSETSIIPVVNIFSTSEKQNI